jgi:hypothetical protein
MSKELYLVRVDTAGIQPYVFGWHFAGSGLLWRIAEIRKREYEVPAGSLTLRPVTLGENPKTFGRAWEVVRKGCEVFQGEEWRERRNKLKALRDTLREGDGAVQWFRTKYGAELPSVHDSCQDWPKKGWQDELCGYFDAIEMADWYIPFG